MRRPAMIMEVLRKDKFLVPFIKNGNLTGRNLGSGLYGSVEEASWLLLCVCFGCVYGSYRHYSGSFNPTVRN